MTRKLALSLLVLAGFTTLAFGSMDEDAMEEILEELDN